MSRLVNHVEALFAGVIEIGADPKHPVVPAFCSNAVCVLLESLVQCHGRPARSKWFQVLPGIIQSSLGAQYTHITDGQVKRAAWPSCGVQQVKSLSNIPSPAACEIRAELVGLESSTDLSVTLRFLGTGTMEIHPTRLALLMAESLGRVFCPLSKTCDEDVSF